MNALVLVTLLVVGQAETDGTVDNFVADEAEVAQWLRPYFLRQAAEYEFLLGSEAASQLTLVPAPLMTWNGDNSWCGDVFIWTHQGRPALIGGIGSWRADAEYRGIFHEFHSLAEESISEVRMGPRYTWKRETPGVVFREIVAAPPPAESRRLRLLQMRRLAREFSASLRSQAGVQTLRMQSPLVRYDESCEQDGAIFPFIWTLGTDPEVLLVLESRETQTGTSWFFAAARFTWREAWMHHQEQEVWHVGEHHEQHQTRKLTQPYATVEVGRVSLAELRTRSTSEDSSVAEAK